MHLHWLVSLQSIYSLMSLVSSRGPFSKQIMLEKHENKKLLLKRNDRHKSKKNDKSIISRKQKRELHKNFSLQTKIQFNFVSCFGSDVVVVDVAVVSIVAAVVVVDDVVFSMKYESAISSHSISIKCLHFFA